VLFEDVSKAVPVLSVSISAGPAETIHGAVTRDARLTDGTALGPAAGDVFRRTPLLAVIGVGAVVLQGTVEVFPASISTGRCLVVADTALVTAVVVTASSDAFVVDVANLLETTVAVLATSGTAFASGVVANASVCTVTIVVTASNA